MEGDADHCGIATLPTGVDINTSADLEDGAQVEARIGYLKTWIEGLRGVIVAVQFQLQAQAIPGRLVFDTTKKGRRTAEIGIGTEVTAAVACFTASALAVAQAAEGVANVGTNTVITPCDAQAQIQIPETLVGNKIFAGEQAGAAHIHEAQRKLRHPVRLLP